MNKRQVLGSIGIGIFALGTALFGANSLELVGKERIAEQRQEKKLEQKIERETEILKKKGIQYPDLWATVNYELCNGELTDLDISNMNRQAQNRGLTTYDALSLLFVYEPSAATLECFDDAIIANRGTAPGRDFEIAHNFLSKCYWSGFWHPAKKGALEKFRNSEAGYSKFKEVLSEKYGVPLADKITPYVKRPTSLHSLYRNVGSAIGKVETERGIRIFQLP